jgi:hypothetical protein
MRDVLEEQNVDEIVRMLGRSSADGCDETADGDGAIQDDMSADEEEGLIVDSEM